MKGIKANINYDDLYDYYIIQNHTSEETALFFKIHERSLRRYLYKFGIRKTVQQQVEAAKRVCMQRYGTEHYMKSNEYKTRKNAIFDKVHQTCLEKYGVENLFDLPEIRQKSIDTLRSKYGVDNVANIPGLTEKKQQTFMDRYGVVWPSQDKQFRSLAGKKYCYNNEFFDSSWELALYIYAIDHNEDIIREPCVFTYIYDNIEHKYFPDFKYRGQIIEIKGNQFLNDKKELIPVHGQDPNLIAAKFKCMNDNNVIIYSFDDLSFVFKYVHSTYGYDYLKRFKNK